MPEKKEKHPGGRPPKYTNPAEMQKIIDQYFIDCDGHPAINPETGEPYTDKNGNPIIIGIKPPTTSGLALALGFESRQTLLNYQGAPEFVDTIREAKSRIEAYAEGRLYDRDGVNGAKFVLKNCFKGWKENPEDDAAKAEPVRIVIEQASTSGESSSASVEDWSE